MIECKKSTVSLLENSVLFIDVGRNQELSLMDYKEIKLASIRLSNKKDVFNLINLGDKTIPDKEAREACTDDIGNGYIKAEAIVVYSLAQRIVAKDIVKRKKKHIPIKLFTSIEKAKTWLDKIKNDLELIKQN